MVEMATPKRPPLNPKKVGTSDMVTSVDDLSFLRYFEKWYRYNREKKSFYRFLGKQAEISVRSHVKIDWQVTLELMRGYIHGRC